MSDTKQHQKASKSPPDLEMIKSRVERPKKAVITAGMPYANGPLHLGHLAGAHIPADIHARWMKMLIGAENVLFVCGSDDHGTTTELSAMKEGVSPRALISKINSAQSETLQNYAVNTDVYSGTSDPECFPVQEKFAQDFMRKAVANKMLEKRSSMQWYDPQLKRFLQDRFVTGKCPNEHCENLRAYSDECETCGAKYDSSELLNPQSELSSATPELKETAHLWFDMWKVSETIREWVKTKKSSWRKGVFTESYSTVLPSISFNREHEDKYKSLKGQLAKHKSRYAPGKKQVLQFEDKLGMDGAIEILAGVGIATELVDGWAHRSITRDVNWGIHVPADIDPELVEKTLYVWPDSLLAPVSFTKQALTKKGQSPDTFKDYWCDPEAKIYQFLGQDNVYFYVVMQCAMWISMQEDIGKPPAKGDLQFTEVFGCHHLQINGNKMSKSTGNFFTGDELIHDNKYDADQIRYFLATLDLINNSSNFSIEALEERNKFLAGPMNAAFEKPISACHSKFGSVIPKGEIHEKIAVESPKIIQRYLGAMPKANYIVMLGAIENYARLINSQFSQFKPHDDRFPEEERNNALYSSFAVLKNIMIMLYPFVPNTMNRLRESLNLPESVFSVEELGRPIAAGHKIGEQGVYFPPVD